MFIRNKLYDLRILKQCSFDNPVICIGNLSTGGTGKTPHTEYLIRLLKDKYKVSVLSRGYKRKTKGFIIATPNSRVEEIGDEPLQFKMKFSDITVAVDENRRDGINKILNSKFLIQNSVNVVLLDDAFQHRAVKAGLTILLTDYHDLFYKDCVLPSGTLREFRSGYKRADIIIITKTPEVLSSNTQRTIINEINPEPYQKIYFSYLRYNSLIPLNPALDIRLLDKNLKSKYAIPDTQYANLAGLQNLLGFHILLFAGIANPYPLENRLKSLCSDLTKIYFNDHYDYTGEDVLKIKEKYLNLPVNNKIIVTTEKDAMRLSKSEVFEILKDLPVFYIPIEIDFHKEDKQLFDKQILDFISGV